MSRVKFIAIGCAVVVVIVACFSFFHSWSQHTDVVSELSVLGFATEASNQKNEDRLITFRILSKGKFVAEVAGVFDGHGGDEASEFVAKNFEKKLVESIRGLKSTASSDTMSIIQSALKITFKEMEEDLDSFLTNAGLFKVGTCGLVVAVIGDQFIAANLGDSEALFISNSELYRSFKLNTRHNANNPDEASRLRREFPGETDVIDYSNSGYRVKGYLQITRSFGDLFLKKRIPGISSSKIINPPYISSTPEFSKYSGNGWVVLATDGLWDHLKNPFAISAILEAPGKTPKQKAESLIEAAYAEAARKKGITVSQLRQLPPDQKRRRIDDISVVILKVGK